MPITDNDIRKYAIRRNPFCHPTVFFKKDAVISVGGYEKFNLFEDYQLWMKIISNDFKCGNIDKCLVYMRTGDGLYNRRGGFRYLKYVFDFRKNLLRHHILTVAEFLYTLIESSTFALIPTSFRKALYNGILREKRSKKC